VNCKRTDSIPQCKYGYGIKQRIFIAFFGSYNSLQELAHKAPMVLWHVC
jgi:hypothetical protein